MQTLKQNTIKVEINGIDYTKNVQFPYKFSNLLDEQLDEASLTLVKCKDKIFKPLTDVKVTITDGAKQIIQNMLVASDKADEIPVGSGKYKHELYLIEQTKYLECFVVRSIGFFNPLGKKFTQVGVDLITENTSFSMTGLQNIYGTTDLKTPIYSNTEYIVPSPSSLVIEWESEKFHSSGFYTYNACVYGKTTINNNGEITEYIEDLWRKPPQYFSAKQGSLIITIEATVLVYDIDNPPIPDETPIVDATIWKGRASITCKCYLGVVSENAVQIIS